MEESGLLWSLDGLDLPSTGARVAFQACAPKVVSRPFQEAEEVIGGSGMIPAGACQEATASAKHYPVSESRTIEVRHVVELAALPDEAQGRTSGLAGVQPKQRRAHRRCCPGKWRRLSFRSGYLAGPRFNGDRDSVRTKDKAGTIFPG